MRTNLASHVGGLWAPKMSREEWSFQGKGKLLEGSLQYRAIVNSSNVVITIGDNIFINSPTPSKPYIARVTGFFSNLTDNQACASIVWFYTADELKRWHSRVPQKERPKLPSLSPNEVVLSNNKSTVEISTISRAVLIKEVGVATPEVGGGNGGCLVARFKVDVHEKTISSIIEGGKSSTKPRRYALIPNLKTSPTKERSSSFCYKSDFPKSAKTTPSRTTPSRVSSASGRAATSLDVVTPSRRTATPLDVTTPSRHVLRTTPSEVSTTPSRRSKSITYMKIIKSIPLPKNSSVSPQATGVSPKAKKEAPQAEVVAPAAPQTENITQNGSGITPSKSFSSASPGSTPSRSFCSPPTLPSSVDNWAGVNHRSTGKKDKDDYKDAVDSFTGDVVRNGSVGCRKQLVLEAADVHKMIFNDDENDADVSSWSEDEEEVLEAREPSLTSRNSGGEFAARNTLSKPTKRSALDLVTSPECPSKKQKSESISDPHIGVMLSSPRKKEGVNTLLTSPNRVGSSSRKKEREERVNSLLISPNRSPCKKEREERVKSLLTSPNRVRSSRKKERKERVNYLLSSPNRVGSSPCKKEGVNSLLASPNRVKSSPRKKEGVNSLLASPNRVKSSPCKKEGVNSLLASPNRVKLSPRKKEREERVNLLLTSPDRSRLSSRKNLTSPVRVNLSPKSDPLTSPATSPYKNSNSDLSTSPVRVTTSPSNSKSDPLTSPVSVTTSPHENSTRSSLRKKQKTDLFTSPALAAAASLRTGSVSLGPSSDLRPELRTPRTVKAIACPGRVTRRSVQFAASKTTPTRKSITRTGSIKSPAKNIPTEGGNDKIQYISARTRSSSRNAVSSPITTGHTSHSIADPTTPTRKIDSTSCATPTTHTLPVVNVRKRRSGTRTRVSKLTTLAGMEKEEESESSAESCQLAQSESELESEGEEEEEAECGESLSVKKWVKKTPRERQQRKRLEGKRPLHKRRRLLGGLCEVASPMKSGQPRTPMKLVIPKRKDMIKEEGGKKGTKAAKFKLAKERLHVSAVPKYLPCREEEFATICSFVESSLNEDTGGCMYISGVPGTGKTATVMEVAEYLKAGVAEGTVPKFNFVEINGLRLTDPAQAYVSILKQLTGERATPNHARALLEKYFSSSKETTPTVLLADELDMLITRRQDVLYSLFDWPNRQRGACLVVLAIANSMDLPERIKMRGIASRMGFTRLTFQPYTFQQLLEIVKARLNRQDLFEPDAIELAVRKVAAVSGDCRRAINLCRRAIDIAESSKKKRVTISDITTAIEDMFSSIKIQAIKHASLHEKLILKAVLAMVKQSGTGETTFYCVNNHLNLLYATEGVKPITFTHQTWLLTRLGSCGLLLVNDAAQGIHRKIAPNLSISDLELALNL